MKFTKMHGIGNNYIYVNCFSEKISYDMMGAIAKHVSDKNFGIGADGAIFICPSDEADAEMKMFNADGSYGEMCGNGIRCVAKYLYDYGIVDKTELTIVSGGKKKQLKLFVKKEIPGEDSEGSCGFNTGRIYGKRKDNMVVDTVRVDMGEPVFDPAEIPVIVFDTDLVDITTPNGVNKKAVVKKHYSVLGNDYEATCVSMGNPHAVIFTDDVDNLDLEKIGPAFENHEIFPQRVNTEFVEIIDRTHVKMRVYERGSGETLACGTGGAAVTAACILCGHTDNKIMVHLLGGDLLYEWDATGHIIMTGPAEYICEGEM